MNDRPTALERAFQLARSGRPKSINDIKRELAKEHYSSGQITGNTLRSGVSEGISCLEGNQEKQYRLGQRTR
jgi:hypothetical protein